MTAFARVAIALLAAPVLFIGGYERGLHAGYTATWPVIQKDAGMYVACEQEIDRLKIEVNRLSGIMLPARNQGVQRVFDASQMADLALPAPAPEGEKMRELRAQVKRERAGRREALVQAFRTLRLFDKMQRQFDLVVVERDVATAALRDAQRGGSPCIARGK